MKIYLYYIGKPRDPRANGMAQDYLDRAARYCPCEMREIRPERMDLKARHPTARLILLDPAGKSLDSKGFTTMVERTMHTGQDLVFVVGGADGLPPGWAPTAGLLLSLSTMTFPHELARAMLAEQIYRALAGLRGHPYPR